LWTQTFWELSALLFFALSVKRTEPEFFFCYSSVKMNVDKLFLTKHDFPCGMCCCVAEFQDLHSFCCCWGFYSDPTGRDDRSGMYCLVTFLKSQFAFPCWWTTKGEPQYANNLFSSAMMSKEAFYEIEFLDLRFRNKKLKTAIVFLLTKQSFGALW
jgi:hypothetical protein